MKRRIMLFLLIFFTLGLHSLPNIMVTGFWSPTGYMISNFSQDPDLNPDGWIGSDWEELGYDIYSFFPNQENYQGDLEVDYQDCWEDFWSLTAEYEPIAIISFGAGAGPWEIEYNARNLNSWISDGNYPYYPTPNPPDDSVEIGYVRHSTLPVENIETAVDLQTPINAWVDWDGNPGAYLCEFMAYLGMWYQNIHGSSWDASPCLSAGFIHVSNSVSIHDAEQASYVTIREVIDYLSSFFYCNGLVIAGETDPQGTMIHLTGERDFEIIVDNSDGYFDIPYMPAGNYNIIAVNDGYYYLDTSLYLDSENPNLTIELEDWSSETTYSWYNEPAQVYENTPSLLVEIASRYPAENLSNQVDNIIGKLNFMAPASSDSCWIKLKLYATTPDAPNPYNVIYSAEIDSFETDQWVEHLIPNPVVIESGTDYWIGYQIHTYNGDIAWFDNGPVAEGNGAYINLSGWTPLLNATGIDANWMLNMKTYGPNFSPTDNEELPEVDFVRLRNYPNPFMPGSNRSSGTNIAFSLPVTQTSQLTIYNIKGQKIRTLIDEDLPAGDHSIYWDGKDFQNHKVGSGVYFYRLKTDNYDISRKMLILK